MSEIVRPDRGMAPQGYEFLADPQFQIPPEETMLTTEAGSVYKREIYGPEDAADAVFIIGGRASMDPMDHMIYDAFSRRLAKEGFRVVTYTLGDDLITPNVQESQQNMFEVAADIEAQRSTIQEQRASIGAKMPRLALLGTSQGAPIALLAARNMDEKVFVGLNVPAVRVARDEVPQLTDEEYKSYEAVPTPEDLLAGIEEHVTGLSVVYAAQQHDQYFPDGAIQRFLTELRKHFTEDQLEVIRDEVHDHIFTGAITYWDPQGLIDMLLKRREEATS